MKFAATILACACALPVFAQAPHITVKPGLWEHSLQLSSESGRIEMALQMAKTQMALLPPEQRQMVEGMIQAQGLKVDWLNQSFQNCVTIEEAASGQFQFAEDGGCTMNEVSENGTSTNVSFTCAQGEGELTMTNGSEYTGRSSMTLDFNGVQEHATAMHSGRWLGASCGDLAR